MSKSSVRMAEKAEVHDFPKTEARTAETPAPAEKTQHAPARKRTPRRFLLIGIAAVALGMGGWYARDYWVSGRFLITTDDAYVAADLSHVSPKVGGYVTRVAVRDNQSVKAGDPLIYIDDGDYKIALAQAEAQLSTQQKALERIEAQITAGEAAQRQSEAQRRSTEAAVTNARRTVDRLTQLVASHTSTQANLDDAQTALDQAQAAEAGAEAQVAAAIANVSVLKAQYAEAQSSVHTLALARQKAERDLGFTVIRAAVDGVVGNRSVAEGDFVTPGQKLAAVVPVSRAYVVANFKETQLGDLAPGETVRIAVDALSDDDVTGTVSSLAPASGAVFSMLPPDNATGNFTKVVQRVPVRIDIDPAALASGRLRAGLSVVVSVDSRTAPKS